MRYVNDRFGEYIQLPKNWEAILAMKQDVDAFMPGFCDSPDRISRWGHIYFCDDDGGRLIFDLASPHAHVCKVCGRVYTGDVYDGVWVTHYRNRAVVLALVSAAVYKATGDPKYRDYSLQVIDFYTEHYHEFILHNKEHVICDAYETMKWGCGRMMPQGLNEAIVAIRFIQAIEILREELDAAWLENVHNKLFKEMFHLLAPQATSIHNISCWGLAAIGVMGLALQDKEMIDFAFGSEYNIRRQLKEGVTADGFWYEGSIHYNFFLLEGVSYLFLFSRIYEYDFGEESTAILERMFSQAYHYAFDNLYLPNPNDGWPDLNLKTFSYVYHTAARAFGENSVVGNLIKIIEANQSRRTTLPLSEPYYCLNDHPGNEVCLEQLLFNLDFDYSSYHLVPHHSGTFPGSNFAMLRNDNWNVFLKYGLNGKSHAHPDLMNIEIMYRGQRITRDLSNAGYRSKMCNEWHRKTLAHNTVCWNGQDITSVSQGECLAFAEHKVTAQKKDVYAGVDYQRTIEITDDAVQDTFLVSGVEGTYDYILHFESAIALCCDHQTQDADLGFDQNGYQHIVHTSRVTDPGSQVALKASVGEETMELLIALEEGQELFLLKTKDNPVNQIRSAILVRGVGEKQRYQLTLRA